MESKSQGVKCRMNGELSAGRKGNLRSWLCIPLHTAIRTAFRLYSGEPLFCHIEYGKKEVFYMSQKQNKKGRSALFGSLRIMTVAALLAAMSFILGKFLQIPNPFSEIIRLSFENLPILFAGICFGPIVGAATGAVADLVGCLLYGYTINPLVTLGAATVGLVSGLVANYVIRRPLWLSCAVSTALAHLTGSVVIKSLGLAAWYLSKYNMGLLELMLWRLLTYSVIGVLEGTVIVLLLKVKAISSHIEELKAKK